MQKRKIPCPQPSMAQPVPTSLHPPSVIADYDAIRQIIKVGSDLKDHLVQLST